MGTTPERRPRLDSVDVMRGLVMVLMALDHARDFWSSAHGDITDAAVTTPGLFATRWVTHLCAPWFMLLAGAGAYLSLGRGKDRGTLSRFLVSRGLWLIVLQFTVVQVGWEGRHADPRWFQLNVIWALGCSMIALALLIRLRLRTIVAIGVVMVLGHDLLDHVAPDRFGPLAIVWQVLHVPGPFGAAHGHGFGGHVLYPLIPWIGVMGLGFAFGAVLDRPALRADPALRARLFARAGAALVVAFVAVRALNVYGDPVRWTHEAGATRTVLSFLDVSKYPPSLDFLLATVGVGLLLLAAIEHLRDAAAGLFSFLRVYGRVPLFFYVIHLPLITQSAELGFRIETGAWMTPGTEGGWGFGLAWVYLMWLAVVLALYLPCRWFAALKRRRHEWWLSYL